MEKHSPSYIQTNHSSEDRDGENYRYFSIKFVKEIEYDDSSSSQEDLDHECREKVRRDWSLKDGSDVKDQQSKKNEEELEVKQLAAIPDTGVTNLIEAWRQQTSHFQTMVEKNDELLEMNLHLMQEMSTIKTNNNHLQEELADVRQYVENMKRDLKQMVPTSTHLSKKYQDLAVSTSDHATCSTASTSSYETTSTSTPTTPWFTVKDPKDDDNLQKNSDIICETPKTSTSGTCTETDKERSCTAISVQKTEKQNYLNSESSHSILMRKFSNDQSSSRTSFVSAVNFDNVILNAHAESNLPSGENTAVNGGQTNPDYRLTRNQLSNDHSNRTEDFTNAFWPIGDQDETPTAEIEDVLIRSSSSLKSSSLLQSSGSHDGSLSKRESWNQITGNRSVTFLDNVTSTSKMENVPEERSKNEDVLIRSSSSLKSSSLLQSSGSHDGSLSKRESWNQITGNRSVTFLDNVTSTSKMENVPEERSKNEDVLIRSSSSLKSSSLLQSSGSHDGSLSKRESWNQITGNRSVTFLDNVTSTSKMENVPEERNLSGTIQNITAASMSSSKEICVKDSIEEISSLSKQEDKFPFHNGLISSDDAHHQSETPSGASGLLNERNDYVDKDLNFDEKSSFVSVKALIQKICSDINKERVGSLAKAKAKAEENVIQHDSSIVETGLALPLSKKHVPVAQCSNTMNLAPSCLPTVGPYASVLPNKGQTTSNDLGIPNNSLLRLNTTASGKSKMPKTVSERHDIAEIPFRKADTSLRKMSLTPKAYKTEHLAHAACVQNTSSKNGNIVVENVGPMIVLTDYDKEQLMISSNISVAGRQQNMHSRETVSERHDIAEIPFRKPAADLRKTSLTPKADKTEHLAHGTCVQNTSSKNGIIVVENVGPMIVVRDCDKEQLTMISSNISVAGKQQNLHSRDKTASLTSQDDNLTCQKTADKDQNRETDIDKILIENVGPIITKPHPSAYTRAQVSKEESSSRILSSVAQKTLFINEKSGLEEFTEKRAVRASQSPASKKGKICKEILDKTASTRKIAPTALKEQKPSSTLEDAALIPEYLCIFFEDAVYHPEADVKVPGTLRVTRDGYDGVMEFKCSDGSLNFWQSLSDMQLLRISSPYYIMWSTYQRKGSSQRTFRLSFQSIESASRLQSIVSWVLRHMKLDSQNFSGSQPSSSHREDSSTDRLNRIKIPLQRVSKAGVRPAGLMSTVQSDSTKAKSSRFTSPLGVSSQFSSLKCTSVETLGSVGKDVKHPTAFPFAEPDASDYQNSSLKEKMPVSSSHEKVPLGRSGSPTTAAGPSVWNSSCGPLPSPPRYRFMFPCTVSILQEKVKQLRFKEKRAKSASGHEKDSSQRQSAGAHPQDDYQTSNSDRLIAAREDGETNSSNLDIRQRDDSLDPRNAWKRLAKTYLSSRGGSRFADLSAQLLYASRIRNLQLATASRPATAPYQRTDSNPRSNGLLRTELSSQGLGTPDAKEVAGFSSSYICIFACHARLVRLDPRGIRCDNKMLHPSVEFVEVQILNLNEPGVYKVVMLSGARVCASHFISKSMILQSLGRSSLSAQKSRSLQETQRDGSVQGSVTRELNPSSSASQQQGKLDVKDRYKSGSRFAAVVEALRSSKATTTTQEVTPGGSELTLGSLGPGWIYTALDMSSKPLHMQCFVLVFPTQKLAIQFKAVFNRCREEVQQASDSILVALSTYGRRKTQENANWSCMHSDAGEGAAELMTSSEILKDCQSGCVSCRREAEKSETTKRTDSGAQQRCCCTRVASSGGLFGNNSCTRKPASVGKNGYSTAGVMASNKDCITDSRSEVMTSRRSACQCIFLPASALITRSEPCCSWVEKAGSHRTRGDCWGRCRTEPVKHSFDAWRHSIGGAVGTEDVVFCEESDLDIATYRRETWRKDAERCHNSSERRVSSLRNCSCNCMNANDGEEATPFADLDNERSSQSFTTAVRVPPITGDSVELHDTMDTMRCSSYEENALKILGSTSAESTAAHAGTATQSELRELTQVERSRRDAGFQSRHLKEEEKGRQASCTEAVWQSCAPIRAIGLGPETTVEADCLAKSRAKEGRLKGGRQSHGTATDAFFASGRLNTTAGSDVDFLSPELQMDTPLWRSLGYLGAEAKDGGPVTSDLNWQGQVDGVTDMTEVFVEYTCSYCQDEDSLSIASDDNFLSLEEDDEENGADEKNAANDPYDQREAGGNTLPNDPQPTGSHQSTFKGNIAVNLPASVTVQTNTETLERSWGLAGEVIRGEQKEGTHEKPSLGDSEKLMAQPQDVPVAGRALACRSTTCSQISLRSCPAEEKQRARSPAVRHGGHPDFRHHHGPCGVMKRDEARSQNGDGVGAQVQWTWLTGNEPQARRPLSRQDDQAGEHLRRLAEREHHRSGSQGDSRESRGRLLQHPSGSGNSCSTLASSRIPDSTFAEDEAVVVSRRDAYSFHTPRSGKYRVTGASESRLCRRDSPGRSTTRGDDASPPTTSAGRSQARRGAWPCTAHPGWTDLDGGGVGLSTSCCVRIVREGDRAARLIVTQLKDDVVLCNRVIDAGLIITQPPKKSPGKVVRLVMSAWHKGKRMKVALWLRFRSSKMADQFIVALREAPRIS